MGKKIYKPWLIMAHIQYFFPFRVLKLFNWNCIEPGKHSVSESRAAWGLKNPHKMPIKFVVYLKALQFCFFFVSGLWIGFSDCFIFSHKCLWLCSLDGSHHRDSNINPAHFICWTSARLCCPCWCHLFMPEIRN